MTILLMVFMMVVMTGVMRRLMETAVMIVARTNDCEETVNHTVVKI